MNRRVWILSLVRVTVVTAALWLLLAGLTSVVRIAPGWPPGAIAFGLALAAELLICLYRYESRNLGGRRARPHVQRRAHSRSSMRRAAWATAMPARETSSSFSSMRIRWSEIRRSRSRISDSGT